MVMETSLPCGPPAGSTRETVGANVAGGPLWQAAPASARARGGGSLEELKVGPHDEGEGALGAARRGKLRVPVDREARLGERNGAREAVLDSEREDPSGGESRLRDARLSGQLGGPRDYLQRRSRASPDGGADAEPPAVGDLGGELEEVLANLRRPELPGALLPRNERPRHFPRQRQLRAQTIATPRAGERRDGRGEVGEVARHADRGTDRERRGDAGAASRRNRRIPGQQKRLRDDRARRHRDHGVGRRGGLDAGFGYQIR